MTVASSLTPEHRLPEGSCRLYVALARRRHRQEAKVERWAAGQPVFIQGNVAGDACVWYLCRNFRGACWDSLSAQAEICYSTSVTIKSPIDWMDRFAASGHDILKLSDSSTDATRCGTNVSHSHASVHSTNATQFLSSCVVAIPTDTAQVCPALSAVFRIALLDNNASPQPARHVDSNASLRLCLKQQLAGKLVINDASVETQIHVQVLSYKCTFTLESVQSAAAAARHSKCCQMMMILPSTSITLLDDISPSTQPVTACVMHDSFLSHTAKLLVETMQHMQQQRPVELSRTFLLSGSPGSGKNFAVRSAFAAFGWDVCDLIAVAGAQLLGSGGVLAAAAELQSIFRKASQREKISLIFLDECDALVADHFVASMLAHCLDCVQSDWRNILVVAATNRIDSIPAMLRRPGRFDKEIPLSPPNADERKAILKALLQETPHTISDDDLKSLAHNCIGFVPADLHAVVRQAREHAMDDTEQRMPATVTSVQLRQARSEITASALRDAALQAPPRTAWTDIAGDPGGAKTALQRAIEWPRTHAAAFVRLGLPATPRGILLHGPPGCAKSSLARAAAHAAQVAFLSLAPADVYATSYVGDAEAVVRRAFALARSASPCILFFDEIDAILGGGGAGDNAGGLGGRGDMTGVTETRVMSTFLNEMDGIDSGGTDGVLVLGATNRPQTLDAALLRPGRFDKIIYVPPPDVPGRRAILALAMQHWNCAMDLDYFSSEEVTGDMTGAELVGACRTAAVRALRRSIDECAAAPYVCQDDLVRALRSIKPLLADPYVLQQYESFEQRRNRSF